MTRSLHPSPVPAPPWPGSVHTPTPTPPPWSRVCHSSFLRTVSAHLLPHSPSSLQQQPRQVQVSILTPLAHPSHSCHSILSGGIPSTSSSLKRPYWRFSTSVRTHRTFHNLVSSRAPCVIFSHLPQALAVLWRCLAEAGHPSSFLPEPSTELSLLESIP